jgi:hypothetical protein
MSRRLFQHPLLRVDIAEALRYTEEGWGKRKKDEYKALNVILVRFLNAAQDLPKQFPDDYDNALPSR